MIDKRIALNNEQIQRIDRDLARPGVTPYQAEILRLFRETVSENTAVLVALDRELSEVATVIFSGERSSWPGSSGGY